MPTYNDELKRDMYRDLAAKQHLAMRMARSGRVSACDATETETAEDYCRRMVEKLGLQVSRDPIRDLTMFLAGHDSGTMSSFMGGRASAAMDSGEPNFLTKYLQS